MITHNPEERRGRNKASSQGSWWEDTPEERLSQQAARDLVMETPLFPDLPVALKRGLGYGPHVDILQHFIYWFHPTKPKMQSRWTLYKTFAEWHEECGLSERQVKKGRKTLGEMGLIGWKRGQYGRVHYRVDWVGIATVLDPEFNTDTIGGQIDEVDIEDDWFGEDFNLDTLGGQVQSGHQGVQANPDTLGVRPNTGDYAGEHVQESTLLQRAAEPAKAEPAAPPINKEIDKDQEQVLAQAGSNKRHSPDGDTQQQIAAVKATVAPPKPDDETLLAEVREVLDPATDRWWGAKFVAQRRGAYEPEKVAKYLADDEDLPYEGRKADLVPVVRYVFWEASHEEAAA